MVGRADVHRRTPAPDRVTRRVAHHVKAVWPLPQPPSAPPLRCIPLSQAQGLAGSCSACGAHVALHYYMGPCNVCPQGSQQTPLMRKQAPMVVVVDGVGLVTPGDAGRCGMRVLMVIRAWCVC